MPRPLRARARGGRGRRAARGLERRGRRGGRPRRARTCRRDEPTATAAALAHRSLRRVRARRATACWSVCSRTSRRRARDVPRVLEEAGLRGMGGAGLPDRTQVAARPGPARRRRSTRSSTPTSPSPGTFKDRVILEELPHLVIEGLLIGCLVTGARARRRLRPPRVRPRGQGGAPRDRRRPRARAPRAACGVDVVGLRLAGRLHPRRGDGAHRGARGQARRAAQQAAVPRSVRRARPPDAREQRRDLLLRAADPRREGADAWRRGGRAGRDRLEVPLRLRATWRSPACTASRSARPCASSSRSTAGGVSDGRALQGVLARRGVRAVPARRSALDTPLDFDADGGGRKHARARAPCSCVADGTDMLDLGRERHALLPQRVVRQVRPVSRRHGEGRAHARRTSSPGGPSRGPARAGGARGDAAPDVDLRPRAGGARAGAQRPPPLPGGRAATASGWERATPCRRAPPDDVRMRGFRPRADVTDGPGLGGRARRGPPRSA